MTPRLRHPERAKKAASAEGKGSGTAVAAASAKASATSSDASGAPSGASAWTAVRVGVVLLLAACCGWMAFAISFHDDAENFDMDGIAGAMPGKPTVRRRRAHGSPAPVVKPRAREWGHACGLVGGAARDAAV